MAKGRSKFVKTVRRAFELKENRRELIPGMIGRYNETGQKEFTVDGRPDFVWVRVRGSTSETVQAFNDTVGLQFGLPVLIERDETQPRYYRVVRRHNSIYQDWGGFPLLPNHAHQHSFGSLTDGGSDPVFVYKRQLAQPFLCRPQGTADMTVYVEADYYYWEGSYEYFAGGSTSSLAAYTPSVGFGRYVTIYLDGATGTIGLTLSDPFSLAIPGLDFLSKIPTVDPSVGMPLAAVYLTNGMTTINWADLYDLRTLLYSGSRSLPLGHGLDPSHGFHTGMLDAADVQIAGAPTGMLSTNSAETSFIELATMVLDDVNDVQAPTPGDGQGLIWSAALSRWIPGAVSGGGGGGGPTSETITVRKRLYANTASGPITGWDVQSIDQTYDHLEILIVARGDDAVESYSELIAFNNDTAAGNYQQAEHYGGGVAGVPAHSATQNNVSSRHVGWAGYAVSGGNANIFNQTRIFIPLYTSGHYKNARSLSGGLFGAVNSDVYTNDLFVTWLDTAAVNRITLAPKTGNWIVGSRIEIYGIKELTVLTGVPAGTGGTTILPVGSIIPWGGQVGEPIPTDWLACDGSAVSRTTYSDLFDVVGTTYGVGDGSTTFNVPDLRGRVIVGSGQGSGLTLRTVGDTGGAETQTLTIGEMPAHTHAQRVASLPSGGGGGINHDTDADGITNDTNATASTGGGGAHNNMPPFGVATFLIKAVNADSQIFDDSEGDPQPIGVPLDGTSQYAARRDHMHAGSHPLDPSGGFHTGMLDAADIDFGDQIANYGFFGPVLAPSALPAFRALVDADIPASIARRADKLSIFAATTSAELAGVISDETGSGALVFATSPTLVTPVLGVATATSLGITGIAGFGFIDLIGQSSPPASPAAGTMRLHSATSHGFTRPEYHNESLQDVVLGQDSVFIGRNVSGVAITQGQVVYCIGSVGAIPTVSLAKADALTTVAPAIGVVLETSIAHNGYGLIMLSGVIDSVNTSSFAAGDALYVSAATAGALTNVKPAYPNFQKGIGIVLNSGVGNGSILISVAPFTGGAELGTNAANYTFGGSVTATSFNKVAITAPATSATLTIDDGKTLRATGTLTLTPSSDGLTLTVPATGTAALGTGASTRLAYWSGTNTLTSNSGLTFDGTSLVSPQVGVNGTPSGARLHVFATVTAAALLQRDHSSTSGVAASFVVANTDTTADNFNQFTFAGHDSDGTLRHAAGIKCILPARASGVITGILTFSVNNASAATLTEAMRITGAGNIGIGTTAPTEKLEINGNLRFTGDPIINALNRFTFNRPIKLNDNYALETVKPGVGGLTTLLTDSTNVKIGDQTNRGLGLALYTAGGVRATIDASGNVGIGTTVFGGSAAKVLALTNTAVAPTDGVNIVQLFGADITAGAAGLFVFGELADLYKFGNGMGEFEYTRTITGAVTDGYAAALRLDPGYNAATALTVARHNYIIVEDVAVGGAGPAAVTDACVFVFDAAAGTHKATIGATTKTTPGAVDAWVKINVNGAIRYMPAYASTTA